MFTSIGSRFAVMAAILVLLTSVIVASFQYFQHTKNETQREVDRLTFAAERSERILRDAVENMRQKVLFLSSTPSIQGIIRAEKNARLDPIGGSSIDTWKDRLAQTFSSLAETNPYIFQIRYIEKSNAGRELVRINRDYGVVFRTDDARLQSKIDRDYVHETLAAPNRSVLLFGIDLNSEFGKIEFPLTPVLRFATPVYDETGTIHGVVVINLNMNEVFERMTASIPSNRRLLLVNEIGDFLIHPEVDKRFGSELDHSIGLATEIAPLAVLVEESRSGIRNTKLDQPDDQQIVVISKFQLPGQHDYEYLAAIISSPLNTLLENTTKTRNYIAATAILLALIGGTLAVMAARLIVQPLAHLRDSAEKLAAGALLTGVTIPASRRDEVGALARSFHRMVQGLEDRQQQLEENERSVSTILDTAASPIITINESGTIQRVNTVTSRFFGYLEDELIGANISLLMPTPHRSNDDRNPQNDRGGDLPTMSRRGSEVSALRKNGTSVPVHVAVAQIQAKGETFFTCIITDLTEMRHLDALRKVSNLKDEFVSTVSHELRTPLTSIYGALGLLRNSVAGELPEKAQSLVNVAYTNSDRLIRLISDILDIEKISAGAMPYDFEPLDLGTVLEQGIEANRGYAEQLGVHLELSEGRKTFKISADADRIAQVLANLISNAAKFSPRGSVVTVRAAEFEDTVRISVIDRGEGIPEQFQDKIFGRFAQADTSDTRKKGGTGLGLAISKAIVEAHGGTIGFETVGGEGTTFHFDLPLLRDSDASTVPSESAFRVLICVADEDLAMQLRVMTKDAGYESDICNAISKVQELSQNVAYSAVILGNPLPGADPINLVAYLHQSTGTRTIPTIVVATDCPVDAPRTNEELTACGVIDWLEVPVSASSLQSSLARASAIRKQGHPRLLMIEDDNDHANLIHTIIGDYATVDCAYDCAQARDLLGRFDYDVVILDLQLPDGNGEDLLPDIARNGDRRPRVLVYSISNLSGHLKSKVDGVLVKSQTNNETLASQIRVMLDGTASAPADAHS